MDIQSTAYLASARQAFAVTSKIKGKTADTTATTTADAVDTSVDSTQAADTSFADYMKSVMGKTDGQQVNEEELFSALVEKQLAADSSAAADAFRAKKSEYMVSMADAKGHAQIEDVTIASLQGIADEGVIDQTRAEEINSIAFRGAQIDDNFSAIYDSIGSGQDTTVALDELASALARSEAVMKGIESGEIDVSPLSLTASSSSSGSTSGAQNVDGTGGFLWKPVSESDSKLVVVLPTELKGSIDRVEVHSGLPPTSETLLGQARASGELDSDGRPFFRFGEAGGSYGSNVQLVVFKNNGEILNWSIDDGSQRND